MTSFQNFNLDYVKNPSLRHLCLVNRDTPLTLWTSFAEACADGKEPRTPRIVNGQVTYHKPRCPCQRPVYKASWDTIRTYQRWNQEGNCSKMTPEYLQVLSSDLTAKWTRCHCQP